MQFFYDAFWIARRPCSCAVSRWYWVLAVLLLAWPQLGQARPPLRGVPPQHLAAGVAHSLLLRPDGTLYAWGENANGQLGDGTLVSRRTPAVVAAATAGVRFKQIATGSTHSLGLTVDGRVLAWGGNSAGQLGDNSTASHATPVPIAQGAVPLGTRFVQVSAGYAYSLALTADGTVYAWGSNSFGQLGDNSTVYRSAPVALALQYVPAGIRFTQIAAGQNHSLALAADGALYSWGSSLDGQLGNGTTDHLLPMSVAPGMAPPDTRYKQIAAGSFHSLALATDGKVYAWGNNARGQLGDGTTTSRAFLVEVLPGTAPAGTRYVQLSAGSNHTLALAADGNAYGWGYNGYGQLGDGTTTDRLVPTPTASTGTRFTQVAAGQSHSLALAADGTPYAWGSNSNAQLGDNSTTQRLAPVALAAGAATGYTQTAAGNSHSVALTATGGLYAWGFNSYGQLGDGTTTDRTVPVPVAQGAAPAGTRFVQVAAGANHSLALTAEGRVYAWGINDYGQLGDGTTTNRATPVAVAAGSVPAGVRFVQVAAGLTHSLALAADGMLYAWGNNVFGQLGDGTNAQHLTPSPTLTSSYLLFVQISAGQSFSTGLTPTGLIYAWGQGNFGQLGTNSIYTNMPMLVLPGAAPAGTRYVQISSGGNHNLALAADAQVYSWGVNATGQLGNNSINVGFTPVLVAQGAAPAGTRFTQVAAGQSHSLALAADGGLYSWGYNAYGQLGDNSTITRLTPVRESSAGTGWTAVATGSVAHHSLALDAQGGIFSAGYNYFGQLGDGSTTNSLVFVRNRAPLPVHAASAGSSFALYPNPAPGTALATGLPTGTVVTASDALGRTVARARADAAGTARLTLAPGLYLVRSGSTTQRLVVE
jgi:alpha-tubulin suppressor-like RCC1 family protein